MSTQICTLENDNHTSNWTISLTVAKWALEICHIPWQHASIIVNWLAEVKWKQRVNLTSCCDHFQRSHVQFFLSIISLCLMREMKIWFLWFSNISVCYRKFGLRQGGPSYFGVWKGGWGGWQAQVASTNIPSKLVNTHGSRFERLQLICTGGLLWNCATSPGLNFHRSYVVPSDTTYPCVRDYKLSP